MECSRKVHLQDFSLFYDIRIAIFLSYRILNGFQRTNNSQEAWHGGLKKDLIDAGRLIQKKILVLHDEQKSQQQKLFR